MTEPLSKEELARIDDADCYYGGWQISAADADRLFEIAEDHARLHAENVELRERLTAADAAGWCEIYTGMTPAKLIAENAKLRERVANLMVAIAPLRIDLPCKCDDDGECQYHAGMLHAVVLAVRAALATCNEETP